MREVTLTATFEYDDETHGDKSADALKEMAQDAFYLDGANVSAQVSRTDYEYGDPCPNCGNRDRFGESCLTHGVTYFDENGNVQDFDWSEFGKPIVVECSECETTLIDKL
jgi:uncharacterized CHY-type Zn-finger protein